MYLKIQVAEYPLLHGQKSSTNSKFNVLENRPEKEKKGSCVVYEQKPYRITESLRLEETIDSRDYEIIESNHKLW